MSKLVITTVGTSLLDKKGLEGTKGWIEKKSNGEIDNLIAGKSLGGQKEKDMKVQEYLENNLQLKDYSAEIASLKLINLNKNEDRVILLFSDTSSCAFCARSNAIYISKYIAQCELGNGQDKDVRKIHGMEAKEAKKFVEGLPRLKDLLDEFEQQANAQKRELVFNITGGYKGLIPLITFFSRRLPHKTLYYLYQESELITITPDLIFKSSNIKFEVTAESNQQGLF